MIPHLIASARRRFAQDALFWICAATVLVLIPLLLAIAWRSATAAEAQETAARAALEQSWEHRAGAQQVALALTKAESSYRRYMMTAEPLALESQRRAAGEAMEELGRLRRGLADHPAQAARIDRLTQVAAAALSAMREPGGEPAARLDNLLEQAQALLDDIRQVETASLEARLQQAHDQTSHARRGIAVSFALVFLAILAAGVMAFRYTLLRTGLIRRIALEAERRQAIFDSAMDAIVTLGPTGAIETVNRSAERIFGYDQSELLGRDISTLVEIGPGGEGHVLDRLRQAKAFHAGQACEFDARRKDGGTFPVDVNLGEMDQPDGAHVVAVMRDCTERKKAELAKDEFVSTVSHELRTPLTSIAGSLGLMTGGAAGPLPEKASRLAVIAENNSRRLMRLINDLLDMEKIQSGQLSLAMQPLDLTDLVRRAIEAMSGLAADLDLTFDYDPPSEPVMVRADADRLTQVLTNLLSNAAKFSPRGGRVTVSLSAEGGRARVAVRDQGPGVPQAFRDKIFTRFAQADSSDTRQVGGTGLGLAIAKEIVERHAGAIWFDSPPDEGATFCVELPVMGG